MNRIDNSGQGIASLGRDEDQYMAHVAQGEMVVPPVISPETRQRIEQELRAAGLSPDEYKVGDGMSINPITGMPEFGWLKKTFKSIKKVAKKVAPVIGPLANFIPGVGPLLSAAIQAGTTKLAGGSWKDALKAGAFSYGAGKLAGGIGGLGKGAGAAKTGGNFFGNAKEFLFKGKDGVGLFGNLGKGIGGLKDRAGEFLFKGDDGVGLFGNTVGKGYEYVMPGDDGVGLFGNMFGGGEGAEYEIQPGDNLTDIAAQNGTTVEALMKANGITDPNMIQAGAKLIVPSSSGGFNIGRNILGKGNTPDFIKSFEDRLKGEDGKFGGGDGMFGGNAGLAALAALYGKATYDASKERQGGLSLTPEVSMDSLGRYSLAKSLGTGGTREEFGLGPAPKSLSLNMGGEARQYFNQGGLAAIAEQDMREGGESDGPGTGTSDDIPAMLSDGEFVMTAAATKGAGAFNVNKTKSGIELITGGKASRKKGVENMRELMDIFEAI
jgi:LysM repeat protein